MHHDTQLWLRCSVPVYKLIERTNNLIKQHERTHTRSIHVLQPPPPSLTLSENALDGKKFQGSPMRDLLLAENCTVTTCHSKTVDLSAEVKFSFYT